MNILIWPLIALMVLGASQIPLLIAAFVVGGRTQRMAIEASARTNKIMDPRLTAEAMKKP